MKKFAATIRDCGSRAITMDIFCRMVNGCWPDSPGCDRTCCWRRWEARCRSIGFTTRRELGVPVAIGVGGTFDVIAGIKKDAPPWVRKCALEWLYRLIQDPKNLWKRYLTTIPWFLAAVLRERLSGRKPRIQSALENRSLQ